jgi:hypothetical protein
MLYDQGQTRATEAKQKPKTQKPRKTLKAGSRGSQPKPKVSNNKRYSAHVKLVACKMLRLQLNPYSRRPLWQS